MLNVPNELQKIQDFFNLKCVLNWNKFQAIFYSLNFGVEDINEKKNLLKIE